MASVTVNVIPPPSEEPIAQPRNWERYPNRLAHDPNEGIISDRWGQYFTQAAINGAASPLRLNSVELTGQHASIGATDLTDGGAAAGLYEVRAYARITTPATTGAATSSLLVTAGWTEGGVPITENFGAALTGNTTATVLTGPAKTIRVDDASPITYATTYASDTAGQMQYELNLTLSRIAG